MPTPHKHAALIKQWADDPSQAVWHWRPQALEWLGANFGGESPSWDEEWRYALGPKPTQPPRRTCVLAGVEFPAPETVEPANGAACYRPDVIGGVYGVAEDPWGDCDTLWHCLEHGLIHLTREAAEQHSKALLAANRAAVEGAK